MRITAYILPVVVGCMSGMILMSLGQWWVQYSAGGGMQETAWILTDRDTTLLLVNYALCSLVAGLVSALVSGKTTVAPPLVVGIALTLAGLFNSKHLDHPGWFTIVNVFVYVPFALLGYLIVRKKADITNA